MRYSNYVFTKGSIVFVRYPASHPNAFLNGRPLIVVSNPTHLMRTLIVCTTGTRDKPGIEASFYNHIEHTFVGDAEVSNIYPYSLMNIYSDQIISSIGQLDPFIMQEVDKAIDFHLGRTNEIPGYLKDCESDIVGIEHNPIQKKYIKSEAINHNFEAPYEYRREHRRGAPAQHTSTEFKPKRKSIEQTGTTPTQKTPINSQITNDEIMEWVNEPITNKIDLSKLSRNPSPMVKSWLAKFLDEKSVALIVSRIVPISLVAKKYSINQRNATFLRITLTNITMQLALNVMNSSNTHDTEISNTPDYIYIGMVLNRAFCNKHITGDTSAYDTNINNIVHKYNINTEDRRTWKSVDNFYCG